jgi:hypothetical protein
MGGVSAVDNALRQALGQGVPVIAEFYDVYRLNEQSTGQWISPANLVMSGYQARIVYKPPVVLQEQILLYKMFYSGMCDPRSLQIGDVLVQTGPPLTDTPDGRIFIFADVQPLMAPTFFRCEIPGSITRPHGPLTTPEPLLGDGGEARTTKQTEWLVTLSQGLFDVTADGPACTIPMGIALRERGGGKQEIKYPTAGPRGELDIFVPDLPGLQLQVNDMVSDSHGNRFRLTVIALYDVGLKGYQCRAETVFV